MNAVTKVATCRIGLKAWSFRLAIGRGCAEQYVMQTARKFLDLSGR